MRILIARSSIVTRSRVLAHVLLLAATPSYSILAATDGISEVERAVISNISPEAIRRVTADLSAPAMEGRGTAQPGGDRAAKYIADRYLAHGLKPMGDAGTFFQSVRFHTAEVLPASTLTAGGVTFAFAKDFVIAPPLPLKPVDVTAALVFASFGVVSQDLKRDDLANLDLRGKVTMILSGKPRTVEESAWKKSGGVQAAISAAGSRGAAAVIVVAESGPGDSFNAIADRYGRRHVSLSRATEPANAPALFVSAAAAAQMLEGTGASLADLRAKAEAGEPASRELGRQLTISLRVSHAEGSSPNVVAVIEGSDAKLKEEAIVFTAHYDAYGIARNGRIYPGAADNALGVAEMLSIAEAISRSRAKPRRSLIFIAVTGEEYGMLGSRYWVEHPTWPLALIAANINFDGVGSETFGQVKQVAGFGAEYSELGEVLRGVAEATGTDHIADPVPEQGIFYRSDHYSFAKMGIPAINIFGGPGGDTKVWLARLFAWLPKTYHQPGDVISADWNWDGPRTIAVIGMLVGLRVANAEGMPKWLPSAPFKRN
jgi:Zn-dependent M28 family amino/carboxypeptidase